MRMLPVALAALLAFGCSKPATETDGAGATAADAARPVVVVETSAGTFEVELFPDKAPVTVGNFLAYVDDGFYDGTIFHRVIEGFMIQGGGYDAEKQKKPTREPIKNEADNGLKNATGTIAMARTSVPDSATSQFFINVEDNEFLDFQSPTPTGYGYAVFGEVVSGMDVVSAIENTPTENAGGAFKNIPTETVVIESIRRKP